MAPPAPKSPRQDSNILQPVKGHLSNEMTLNLLNGKVLRILGNKSTVEKDRSSPEILTITALVNWEMVSQRVGRCGKILWFFRKKKYKHNSVNPFCKYLFKYAHAEEHMQADI